MIWVNYSCNFHGILSIVDSSSLLFENVSDERRKRKLILFKTNLLDVLKFIAQIFYRFIFCLRTTQILLIFSSVWCFKLWPFFNIHATYHLLLSGLLFKIQWDWRESPFDISLTYKKRWKLKGTCKKIKFFFFQFILHQFKNYHPFWSSKLFLGVL